MIEKEEIERIIRYDLIKVLSTQIFYHFSDFETSVNDILLKQSLRFSDPLTFNDPFDCNENLLKIYNTKEVYEDAISTLGGNLSRNERRKLKHNILKPSVQAGILKSERKKFKIACFSEIYNEVLMWSHYGKKHTGICIGFEFPHQYEDKFILCPVKYLDKFLPLDGKTDVNRTILYWLTTKSKRWEYEKEIRAITKCKSTTINADIRYKSEFVKEVIFGCKVTDSKIVEAISKIRKSHLPFDQITFKKMIIDESTFLLKEEIINTAHNSRLPGK
ncbi:MAG: hypothetical protein H6Q25_1638 [Bacteroidetes bacterium]|nr:hypothetical protein [Bacteroidota bacterium]